jgi:hypothetical protein
MSSQLAADDPLTRLDPEHPEVYLEPPFSSVEHGLLVIDTRGPEHLATDTLRDDIRWLVRQQRALEAITARWLAALDQRQDSPPSSATEWMTGTFNVTPNAAYSQLRTVRVVEHLPRAWAALRLGRISWAHVRVICGAAEQWHKTSLDPALTEIELVGAAESMDPRTLHQHWLQMRYQADREAGEAAEKEQRKRRWLSLRETWWGTYQVEGELDAENGALFHSALRAVMGRKARDDDRTPNERRADAVGELARRLLDAGELPARGGERPHLVLVASVETLRLEPGSPMARLNWGQGPLVTGRTARRIAEDASVTPVLVDGAGNVLHVGRRSRTVPAAVRRALNLRDRGCQGPGCTMPPELCSPHHRVHWADDGGHDLPNLELRCSVHHARQHPENDRFRQRAGQPAAVPVRAP